MTPDLAPHGARRGRFGAAALALAWFAGGPAQAAERCNDPSLQAMQQFVHILAFCNQSAQDGARCLSSGGYSLSGTATFVHPPGYVLTAAHNIVPFRGSSDHDADESRPRRRAGQYSRSRRAPPADNPEALSRRLVTVSRRANTLQDSPAILYFAEELARQYGEGPDVSILKLVDAAAVERTMRREFGGAIDWPSFGYPNAEAYDSAYKDALETNINAPRLRTAPLLQDDATAERIYDDEWAITWAYPAAWRLSPSERFTSGEESLIRTLGSALQVGKHPRPSCFEVEKDNSNVFPDPAGALTASLDAQVSGWGSNYQHWTYAGMSGASQLTIIKDSSGVPKVVVRGVFKGLPCAADDERCQDFFSGAKHGRYHMIFEPALRFSIIEIETTENLPPPGPAGSGYLRTLNGWLDREGPDRVHAAHSVIDANDDVSMRFFMGDAEQCGAETTGINCIKFARGFAESLTAHLKQALQSGRDQLSDDATKRALEIIKISNTIVGPLAERFSGRGFDGHERALNEFQEKWVFAAAAQLKQSPGGRPIAQANGGAADALAQLRTRRAVDVGVSSRVTMNAVYEDYLTGERETDLFKWNLSESVRSYAAALNDLVDEGYLEDRGFLRENWAMMAGDSALFAPEIAMAAPFSTTSGPAFFADILGNYAYAATLLDSWKEYSAARARVAKVTAESLTLDPSTPLALAAGAAYARRDGNEALAKQLLARAFVNSRDRATRAVGTRESGAIRGLGLNVRLITADPAIAPLDEAARRALSNDLTTQDVAGLIARLRAEAHAVSPNE